jgi:hypothetical protein
MGSLRSHLSGIGSLAQLPKDPYEHATLLLEGTKQNDYQDKMNFSSKRAKLANLGSDKLLELEQDEVRCLIDFYDMAIVDPVFRDFAETRYAKWINAIDLTRGRDNAERKQQARVGVTPNTEAGYGSYGAEAVQFQQDQRNEKKDFLTNLFNKGKGGG